MTASLLSKVTRVRVDELTPFPGNPRRGDVDAIAESLNVNGQVAPIVVQKGTNVIVGGNHTARAAQQLGWSEIDVVYVDVDDITAKRIVLALNRTADLAYYDNDALTTLLAELSEVGDLTGSLYSPADLEVLLATVSGPASVDELAARYGEPNESDLWPVLRFKVSPETKARYEMIVDGVEGSDADRFGYLLDLVPAG